MMETQKTRHGKRELFMFKHGNRTSTLSLLGWRPGVISQPVWLQGPAYGFPRLCCGPSVRERWVISGICSWHPLSRRMVCVVMLCPLHVSSSSSWKLRTLLGSKEGGNRAPVGWSFGRLTPVSGTIIICAWRPHGRILVYKAGHDGEHLKAKDITTFCSPTHLSTHPHIHRPLSVCASLIY